MKKTDEKIAPSKSLICSPEDQTHALPLIRDLCNLLASHQIKYCHWKSNAMLDRSARGENDLDLLVSREDAVRFKRILCDLGFKQALPPASERQPAILDYYGLDETSGKLVHVHAHYRLVCGHDATKNYHLPVENAYLESTYQNGLFRIPVPEFEFVVFVIRMVLKHATWEVILSGHGHLSPSESQEFAYLKDRISPEKVREIIECNLPQIDPDLFARCVQAIERRASLLFRIDTGRRLQSRLKTFARRRKLLDTWLILWSRPNHILQSHLLRKESKKRLANGGLTIAIVGGDGSGKTTAIREISSWLSGVFDVCSVHMGKPRWSWLTVLIRGVLKIGRSIGLYPFMRAEIQYTKDREALKFPGYPWAVREICTARDRLLTYTKGRRFAVNGGITLCDRYPLPYLKYMDGPQIEWLACNARPRRLLKWMAELEKRYYQQIALPDLLIVLKTHPGIAVERKTDESPASVWSRSSEVWEMDWKQTPAWVVDASRPKEEVLSEVKRIVWAHL